MPKQNKADTESWLSIGTTELRGGSDLRQALIRTSVCACA